MNQNKTYMPAVFLALSALFFILFPVLASYLIAAVLLAFAIMYVWIVYQFHRAVRFKDYRDMGDFEQRLYERGGPGIRNVTVTILKG